MFVLLLCHSKGHKRNTTGYNPEIFQSFIGHERKQVLVANRWPVKKGEADAQQSLRIKGRQHSGSAFTTSMQ